MYLVDWHALLAGAQRFGAGRHHHQGQSTSSVRYADNRDISNMISLLIFPLCITHRRTHFCCLPHNIFSGFPFQAIYQLGIFNLPVFLA